MALRRSSNILGIDPPYLALIHRVDHSPNACASIGIGAEMEAVAAGLGLAPQPPVVHVHLVHHAGAGGGANEKQITLSTSIHHLTPLSSVKSQTLASRWYVQLPSNVWPLTSSIWP